MRTIQHILQEKDSVIWSVTPSMTVYEALSLMSEKNVGAVLVMENDELVGIFSERDYARKVVLKGKSSREMPVREIMTAKVVYIRPEQTAEEAMAVMTNRHIRHLPVIENDQLLGLISIGDVVKAIISEREFIIEQLENYISSVR